MIKYYKEFIPIDWFTKKDIDALVNELLKVRGSNEKRF